MNRYQGLLIFGVCAAVVALVVLAVFATAWVRNRRKDLADIRRTRAIANAKWEPRTEHKAGKAVVSVARVARWDQQSEILDAIRVGMVSVDELDWAEQVAKFRFDADQLSFQLNLENSG